jgi:hypothetical protein
VKDIKTFNEWRDLVVNNGIPDEVKKFIVDHINSVEQLEVLLFLRSNEDKEWDAAAVSRELRIDPASAANRMSDLSEHGLLALKTDTFYRYYPRTRELDQAVRYLADSYSNHRYTIINLIFSKPIDKIRTFSNAFKIRKDGE